MPQAAVKAPESALIMAVRAAVERVLLVVGMLCCASAVRSTRSLALLVLGCFALVLDAAGTPHALMSCARCVHSDWHTLSQLASLSLTLPA